MARERAASAPLAGHHHRQRMALAVAALEAQVEQLQAELATSEG